MKKSELIAKIKKWATAYYSGEPLVSDKMFDKAIALLKKHDPTHPLLQTTGWGGSLKAMNHLKKFPHHFPVETIKERRKQPKDLDPKKVKPWGTGGGVISTLKLDGGDAVVYYKNGILERCLSAGAEDNMGLDITKNVIISGTIPQKISPDIIAVRGQIIMTWEDFEKEGGTYPRNKAVGISMSKNSTRTSLKRIKFMAFDLIERKDKGDFYKREDLNKLKTNGFLTVPYELFESWGEFLEKRGMSTPMDIHFLSRFSSKLMTGYLPVDGLVINSRNMNSHSSDFSVKSIVYKSLAWKFRDKGVKTKVLEIIPQVSRTGRVVPVIRIDPIILSGAKISRITGNNYAWIKEMGCGVGSIVEVIRSNLVIPQITRTIASSEVFIPAFCPECGRGLIWVSRDLMCKNPICPAKERPEIRRFFELGIVDGIGNKIIDKVCESFDLFSLERVSKWSKETTLPSIIRKKEFGSITCAKLYQIANKLKFHVWSIKDILYVSNIPGVGRAASEALGDHLSVKEFIRVVNENKVPQVLRIYFPSVPAFTNFFNNLKKVKRILKIINPEWKGNSRKSSRKKGNRREGGVDSVKVIPKKFRIGKAPEIKIGVLKNREKDYKDFGEGDIYPDPYFIPVRRDVVKIALTGALSRPRKRLLEEFSKNSVYDIRETSIAKADLLITDSNKGSVKYLKACSLCLPIYSEKAFRKEYGLLNIGVYS